MVDNHWIDAYVEKIAIIFDWYMSFIKIYWRRVSGTSLPIIKSCLILVNSFSFKVL